MKPHVNVDGPTTGHTGGVTKAAEQGVIHASASGIISSLRTRPSMEGPESHVICEDRWMMMPCYSASALRKQYRRLAIYLSNPISGLKQPLTTEDTERFPPFLPISTVVSSEEQTAWTKQTQQCKMACIMRGIQRHQPHLDILFRLISGLVVGWLGE